MRRAFTLIEMLVVLAIIMIVAGMVITVLPAKKAGKAAEVHAAADQLASTLKRARSLAMASGAMHAVVFNIANSAGSHGRVLDNWQGGHWYRILGPMQADGGYGVSGTVIPSPFGGNNTAYNSQLPARNFPGFLESVKRSWVGDPIRLPAKRVRFLALSDLDLGNRMVMRWTKEPGNGIKDRTGVANRIFADTWPRPWFGVLRQVSASDWRWYAWGGLDTDPATKATYPGGKAAGFYTNSDGLISNGVLTAAVSRDFWMDFNGDNDASDSNVTGWQIDRDRDGANDASPNESGTYVIQKSGEVRPLVNAEWVDAAICFLPDGSTVFQEWNRARHHYANDNQGGWHTDQSFASNRSGVRELSVLGSGGSNEPNSGSLGGSFVNRPLWATNYHQLNEEVQHFTAATGGWFLTLGPDAQPGADSRPSDRFATSREALESVLPAYRVFVGRGGVVQTIAVRRTLPTIMPDGTQLTYDPAANLWPGAASFWTTQADVARWCRFGLKTTAVGDADSIAHDRYPLDPRAWPVTDTLTIDMWTGQRWWVVEP
jgi:prepilin-type N-terminal cleavage/methylation domain-containing protein